MYKKVLNPKSHRNKNCHAVYVDGRRYDSLFQASIDFEFGYCWFYTKVMQADGPIMYSKHQVVLEAWVKAHPEYKLPETPEGEKKYE